MAGYSLQQIIGYVPLTGVIQATMSGIPNPLPPAFLKVTEQIIGDAGVYTRLTGERRTAKLVKYGAPAVSANLRDVATQPVKLLHSFEKQSVNPIALQSIRNFDNYDLQRRGMQEISRQVREFGRKFQNLRVAATLMVLANGILYFDGDGNLLPTSSGAIDTVSFQMSANNQNQLNGIITASWATTTTNIPLQLINLEERAAQTTGYELTQAMYGKNIPTYFILNDYVVDYLARMPNMSTDYLKNAGKIPSGLFGYSWIPMYQTFYEDSAGINQSIWDSDLVVFTPEVNGDIWDFMEGSYPVPTDVNITTDAVAAMSNIKDVFGGFSYGQATHDPVGICTWTGDTFMPVMKNPDAYYQANVTP